MEKTIEERAWNSAVKRMQGDSSYAIGYKDGATEQKAIDDKRYEENFAYLTNQMALSLTTQRANIIAKACEWLSKQGQDWWEGYGIPFTLADFKKAMEE